VADYAEYLRTEGLAKRQKQAAVGAEITEQMIQDIKNRNAPVINGGGGQVMGQSGGSYTGSLSGLPSMKGKVNPINGRVSQNWGKSNIKYAAGRHTGMDFAAPVGTRVGSAASGIVTRVGNEGAYGNTIRVRHADGTTTLYAHLAGINVKPGQKVSAGQQIGKSGNTGRSTGAHLHFEVRKQDKYGGDINPRSWYSTR
jgi:murein DD-endopeptidase MepM/ murein hydrolase activator NlpD